MWRGRFLRSLTRKQVSSPTQSEAFERAGWLRPGQAGVILIGAVRPVHIAATFVDPGARGYLRIEETAGPEPDWLITRLRPASRLDQDLTRYEKTLLRKVLRRGRPVRLSRLRGTSGAFTVAFCSHIPTVSSHSRHGGSGYGHRNGYAGHSGIGGHVGGHG